MPRWPVAGDGQSHREICGEGGDEDGATLKKKSPCPTLGARQRLKRVIRWGFRFLKNHLQYHYFWQDRICYHRHLATT